MSEDFSRGRSGLPPSATGDDAEYAAGRALRAGDARYEEALEDVRVAGYSFGYDLTHRPLKWARDVIIVSAVFGLIGALASQFPLQRGLPLQDGVIVGVAALLFQLALAALVLGAIALMIVLPMAALFGAIGAGAGWLLTTNTGAPATVVAKTALEYGIIGLVLGSAFGVLLFLRNVMKNRRASHQ